MCYDNLFSDYEKCFLPMQVTCSKDLELSRTSGQAIDYESCKTSCNKDSDCTFIYYLATSNNICIMYRSCNKTRKPVHGGITSSKHGNCPSKLSFSSSNREYIGLNVHSKTLLLIELFDIFHYSEIEIRTLP